MARRYPLYAGEAVIVKRGRKARRFKPHGPIFERHAAEDVERLGGGGYAARFFVGLNVGMTQGFTVEDVIERVVKVRQQQGVSPNASILAQRGIYEDREKRIVDEPSVQIIIIDIEGMRKADFIEQMTELGEALVKELQQESVILEIQKRGVVTDVFTIT